MSTVSMTSAMLLRRGRGSSSGVLLGFLFTQWIDQVAEDGSSRIPVYCKCSMYGEGFKLVSVK